MRPKLKSRVRGLWPGLVVILAAGGALAGGPVDSTDGRGPQSRGSVFAGSRAEAERFMAYDRSIHLTPAQQEILHDALQSIPAPCCSNFSAATCCCPCNLARTIWGLSKSLIVHEGLGAPEVREAVTAWLQAAHPSGHTGDACFTGRCGHPISGGGCGGMDETHLVFP